MLTPQIIVILFTRRLPYVQCSKNRLTCENYIAVYKIFQEHQVNSRRFPVFPGAISNSRRCPGVVYTQFYTLNGIPVTRSTHLSHNGKLKHRLHLSSITLWTLLTLPAGVCWAGSMKRNGVHTSVRPSAQDEPTVAKQLLEVCCPLPGQEISIDCCSGSGQMRAVPRWERTYDAEHRSVLSWLTNDYQSCCTHQQ